MGAKFVKKGIFKRLFVTEFDLSALIFVKFYKMSPLWVQKSAKPYPQDL